jgi:hypothetical protein
LAKFSFSADPAGIGSMVISFIVALPQRPNRYTHSP